MLKEADAIVQEAAIGLVDFLLALWDQALPGLTSSPPEIAET